MERHGDQMMFMESLVHGRNILKEECWCSIVQRKDCEPNEKFRRNKRTWEIIIFCGNGIASKFVSVGLKQ